MFPTRKLLIPGAAAIVVMAFAELALHALIAGVYGAPTWTLSSTEVFNAWTFTERVDDARVVTLKSNVSFVERISANPDLPRSDARQWKIGTNANRFRNACASAKPHAPAVVILGDSVPFGWGLDDANSAPYLLCQLLAARGDTRQVINAAIPSYSLQQAVARYRLEIHGKEKVDSIYIQTYDPVSQVMIFGSQWKPEYSWSKSPKVWTVDSSSPITYAVKYSSIGYILHRIYIKYFGVAERYSRTDAATTNRVKQHVRSELLALASMARADGARRILVAPVTIPPKSFDTFSESRKFIVREINAAIEEVTHADAMFQFLDTRQILEELPEATAFIDRCCHLSAAGARKLAEAVAKRLI